MELRHAVRRRATDLPRALGVPRRDHGRSRRALVRTGRPRSGEPPRRSIAARRRHQRVGGALHDARVAAGVRAGPSRGMLRDRIGAGRSPVLVRGAGDHGTPRDSGPRPAGLARPTRPGARQPPRRPRPRGRPTIRPSPCGSSESSCCRGGSVGVVRRSASGSTPRSPPPGRCARPAAHASWRGADWSPSPVLCTRRLEPPITVPELALAEARGREALAIDEENGDAEATAYDCLLLLSTLTRQTSMGESPTPPDAASLFARGQEPFDRLGDDFGSGVIRIVDAMLAIADGDLARADARVEAASTFVDRLGERFSTSRLEYVRGMLEALAGSPTDRLRPHRAQPATRQRVGHPPRGDRPGEAARASRRTIGRGRPRGTVAVVRGGPRRRMDALRRQRDGVGLHPCRDACPRPPPARPRRVRPPRRPRLVPRRGVVRRRRTLRVQPRVPRPRPPRRSERDQCTIARRSTRPWRAGTTPVWHSRWRARPCSPREPATPPVPPSCWGRREPAGRTPSRRRPPIGATSTTSRNGCRAELGPEHLARLMELGARLERRAVLAMARSG